MRFLRIHGVALHCGSQGQENRHPVFAEASVLLVEIGLQVFAELRPDRTTQSHDVARVDPLAEKLSHELVLPFRQAQGLARVVYNALAGHTVQADMRNVQHCVVRNQDLLTLLRMGHKSVFVVRVRIGPVRQQRD